MANRIELKEVWKKFIKNALYAEKSFAENQ